MFYNIKLHSATLMACIIIKNNSPQIKNRNHLYLRDKMLRIET